MSEQTKEWLEARSSELRAQINDLSEKLVNVRQKLAAMQTDIKVGDRVTYEGAKYVWQVTGIVPGYGNKPKILGAKIKKDGNPGVQTFEIYVPWNNSLVKVDVGASAHE